MKNRVMLIFVLFLLITTLFPFQGKCTNGERWEVLEFKEGQSFTYKITREEQGIVTFGEVTIIITDNQDGQFRLTIEGEFDGITFEASAPGKVEDIEDIFVNFGAIMLLELPYEVNEILSYTIWRPWMETPLYDKEISSGWEGYVTDDYGDTYWLRILDNMKYVGFEGYLIQMETEEDDEYLEVLEVCVNPELPLPLMANTEIFVEDETAMFTTELIDYAGDSDSLVSDGRAVRVSLENKLLEVVEYFRKNNLEVGERYLKSYKMLDAAAGFGLEVEGGDIELYIFDPETAEKDTLKGLNEARDSGSFYSPSFNIEIPVVLNGNIMLTGLEYGSHYSHPAKDKVIEVFKSFK